MTIENILLITLIIAAVLLAIYTGYRYLQDKTLDDIRADVYQLFLEAEYTYLESGSGKQKMKYVISRARSLLPPWAGLIITDELFMRVVECWFQAIKDLLDDGKLNKSQEE